MTERYWEAEIDPTDYLLDLISDQVASSVKEYWEEKQLALADDQEGRVVVTFYGPPKPTAEDPAGLIDIYTLEFDLLDMLRRYSEEYEDLGGPRGPAQREDLLRRAATLKKLSADIAELAARAEESAGATKGSQNESTGE